LSGKNRKKREKGVVFLNGGKFGIIEAEAVPATCRWRARWSFAFKKPQQVYS
jgi:hypothetical protein